jgi:hypothetical protein
MKATACNFVGELPRPGAAGAQVRRRKEHARRGILMLDRGLEPLRQCLIRRVIAEEPAPRARVASILICDFVDQIRKLPPPEQAHMLIFAQQQSRAAHVFLRAFSCRNHGARIRSASAQSTDVIQNLSTRPRSAHEPTNAVQQPQLRGRDASYLAPPAQIRTYGFPAYGSHLGY